MGQTELSNCMEHAEIEPLPASATRVSEKALAAASEKGIFTDLVQNALTTRARARAFCHPSLLPHLPLLPLLWRAKRGHNILPDSTLLNVQIFRLRSRSKTTTKKFASGKAGARRRRAQPSPCATAIIRRSKPTKRHQQKKRKRTRKGGRRGSRVGISSKVFVACLIHADGGSGVNRYH